MHALRRGLGLRLGEGVGQARGVAARGPYRDARRLQGLAASATGALARVEGDEPWDAFGAPFGLGLGLVYQAVPDGRLVQCPTSEAPTCAGEAWRDGLGLGSRLHQQVSRSRPRGHQHGAIAAAGTEPARLGQQGRGVIGAQRGQAVRGRARGGIGAAEERGAGKVDAHRRTVAAQAQLQAQRRVVGVGHQARATFGQQAVRDGVLGTQRDEARVA